MSVEWKISKHPIAYDDALAFMEQRVENIISGQARECIWLLEHPPLYTAGTSTNPEDLKDKNRFPIYKAGRGGQYTYHGPGQRVAYVMLDLGRRQKDVRLFIQELEHWIIDSLAGFGLTGEIREGRVGIWVQHNKNGLPKEDKIAAIGVRLRKWVTFHGISLNINPDLEHFSGIVPCGITQYGVTSLEDMGQSAPMHEVDKVLKNCFELRFGKTTIGKR